MKDAQFQSRLKEIQSKYESIIDRLVKSNQTDQLPAIMSQYQSEMEALTSPYEAPILNEMAALEKEIEEEDKRLATEEARESR